MTENVPKNALGLPILSLFASTSTLVCCALPALMVSLGMGASLAGLVSTVPQLVWLSKYKIWVFSVSALMLLLAGYWQYRAKDMPCPTDPGLARSCTRMRKISLWVYLFSVLVYIIGFFFAFLAVYLI